jgi:hypothetical protein
MNPAGIRAGQLGDACVAGMDFVWRRWGQPGEACRRTPAASTARLLCSSAARPKWTAAGVIMAIPECRCSWLYQWKHWRQWYGGARCHRTVRGNPSRSHRGRNRGHRRGGSVTAYGELSVATVAGSSRTPSCHACPTRAVWQYRPVPSLSGLLSTLTGASRIRLPPASTRPLGRPGDGGLSPPFGSTARRRARCPTLKACSVARRVTRAWRTAGG